MALDSDLLLMASAALLMIVTGLKTKQLDLRNRPKRCPSCGRRPCGC